MAERMDILDARDPVAGPAFGALLLHLGIAALLFFGWFWMNRSHENFGEAHPAGGPAYAVSAVHNIPIPRRDAPPNPVANDTQSMTPSAPAKQEAEKKIPQPDKNAFEIPDKIKRQTLQPSRVQQYTPPAPQNQVYSRSRTSRDRSELATRKPPRLVCGNRAAKDRAKLGDERTRCGLAIAARDCELLHHARWNCTESANRTIERQSVGGQHRIAGGV